MPPSSWKPRPSLRRESRLGPKALRNGGKTKPVEPVSAGLYVLAAVSRLQANPDEASTEKAKADSGQRLEFPDLFVRVCRPPSVEGC